MQTLKSIVLIVVASILSVVSIGQEKELSISDAVINQYRHLYPEYLSNLTWRGNLDMFTHVVSGDSLIQESATKSGEILLLDLNDINTAMYSLGRDSLKRFPRIVWENDNVFSFKLKNQKFLYDISKKIISEGLIFPEDGNNFIKNSNEEYAYNVNDNLFFLSDKGDSYQITEDGKDGIIYGKTVHRSEFGITNGIFWSPNSNLLAFYRKDETMVTDYPIVDISARVAELKNIKYPMAGMESHHVTVGVFNKFSKKVIYLNTGEPKEQYLTNISWSPDEKYIYIAVLNRGQNHMKFNQYDAQTGQFIKTLFEEKSTKYVEPEHPALFIGNKSDRFIWQSERDGFNHLYLIDTDGNVLKQLTTGNWEVTEVLGFDKSNRNLYLITTKDSPIERHVYKLEIKSSEISKLTTNKGTHSPNFNKSRKYFIDVFSNTKTPRQYDIVSSKGNKVRTLMKAENPLLEYNMGEMSIFTIKAADNETDLYCRLIKPANFDSAKKYPAVIYVYGGPHAQLVTDNWLGGARMWQYYMAQKGYVMLTVDNRGSAHRGFDFESIIHREAGLKEVDDQLKGVDYLKSLGYVDMDRIGVHGWSYGGFMTTSLITRYPDIFKVAVAGGPVIDWKYYEIMYGERYMDTPEENPEGYKETSLIPLAGGLEGKLLIIHGALDPTVVWQNSLSFIEECIKQNKQVDYFVYPMHEHNVRGYDRIHLMDKVSIYFDDFL